MQKRKSSNYSLGPFLLGLVIYQSLAQAQITCTGDSVSPDFSLRSQGKSLQSMQLQDQDGLGTCYANALSLAMEAELGTPVSYHQIAVNYGQRENATASGSRRRAVTERDDDNFVSEVFTEGGNACEAFDLMRARRPRSICRRGDVPLENLNNPDDQERIFNNLSEFYDSFTDFRRNHRTAARQFADSLRDAITSSQTSAPARCQTMHDEPNKTSENMKSMLENFCAEEYSKLKDTTEHISNLVATMSELTVSADDADRRTEIEARIRRLRRVAFTQRNKIRAIGSIEGDALLAAGPDPVSPEGELQFSWPECHVKESLVTPLRSHMQAIETAFNQEGEMNPEATMRPLVNRFLASNLPSIAGAPDFPAEIFNMANGTPMSEDILRSEFSEDLSKAVPGYCRQRVVWQDLQNPNIIQQTFYNRGHVCLSSELLDSTVSAFSGLSVMGNGSFPSNELLTALTNVDSGLNDFMMGVAGPGCQTDAITIPSSLRCREVHYPTGVSSRARRGKTAAEISALERQRSAEHMRTYVNETLQMRAGAGRPVMISVCSGFLKNDTFDSDFGRSCTDGIENHGSHAMNIVGYRCRAGKVEYQIQNSWGQGCGSYRTTDEPSRALYDCNSDGGYIWVPEDVLVPSTKRVYRLEG